MEWTARSAMGHLRTPTSPLVIQDCLSAQEVKTSPLCEELLSPELLSKQKLGTGLEAQELEKCCYRKGKEMDLTLEMSKQLVLKFKEPDSTVLISCRVTRRAVRRCVLKEKPDILFIQETKLKSVDDWLRKSLWVKSSANSLVTSMGASGPISLRKIGYLLNSIVKIIIRSEHAYLFGKIYAPNIDAEREGFFASVTDILLNVSCPVCLGGDFSAEKYTIEESIWLQKSRLSWLRLGDRNTNFFHISASIRKNMNKVLVLKVGHSFFSDPDSIKFSVANKSSLIGFGIEDDLISLWASIINCKVNEIPSMYVGLPLGARGNSLKVWDPVIQNFRRKLECWKRKLHSFEVRIVLIKSVVSSLPVYFMSLFPLHVGVFNELNSIQMRFISGGCLEQRRIHFVDWNTFSNVLVFGITVSLGDGSRISCWKDTWAADFSLAEAFSRVFALSVNKRVSIIPHVWKLTWKRYAPPKVEVFVWKAKWPHISASFLDLVRALMGVLMHRSTVASNNATSVWSPPPKSHLKFNVDGTAFGKSGPARMGEAFALFARLYLRNAFHLIIETEFLNAYKWVLSPDGKFSWTLCQIFFTIEALKLQIPHWSICKILQACNDIADSLAKVK
ncbi:hypothetical protein M9H77_22981 [Catharanthus roseus]|uniref:Uncharacterized protein n=1 Tax=Catharanthus roseus TaxID=4058 RepID=A0ACC0ARR3_CATRO|nr:hypothetical protein M9H77_22981 [Catharanthus roseus]